MSGKAVIRFVLVLFVVNLLGEVVTSPEAVNLPARVDTNFAHAAEQASSVLYLPITLKGLPENSIFGLEMGKISEQGNLHVVTAADTAWVRRNGLL